MIEPQTSQADDAAASIRRILAELGEDVAWSLGTITNETHMARPFGRGVSVTLNGAGTEAHPGPITVWEKGHDFHAATERAIARYRLRAAGSEGA